MKPTITSVKGTRDYYPEEMAVRNFLYRTARKVSESFGYQEWDAPFLETIDLYAAKSGEELVKEQAFVFPDRGGDLITLRPELTPSLARLVAQRQRQLTYPLRWWSWGPFWRYERPQKGRSREFFQWNIDLIGVDTPEADAEMVAIAASFLREAGLAPRQVRVLVNNRKLVEDELAALGIPPDKRKEIFQLIDRRDKLTPEGWHAYARDIGLDNRQLDGLKAFLADDQLWRKSHSMLRFFTAVDSLGVSEYVRFAPHVVRGLDYYTSVVWEAWDQDGEFRAILGGGRYDNLVSDVGGDPLPATGFAMGDLVASLVLKKFDCLPKKLGASPARVLVTVFDEASFQASYSLAAQLRSEGIDTAVYPEAVKLSRQFKYGDRMDMRLALVLGPDEQKSGQVAVKDLRTGEQHQVSSIEIVETIKRTIA
jgi:histidyl-tRNA synthetase